MNVREELSKYLSQKFGKNIKPLKGFHASFAHIYEFGDDNKRVIKVDFPKFYKETLSVYEYLKNNPQLPIAKVYSYGTIVLPEKIVNNKDSKYRSKVDTSKRHNQMSFPYCIMERVDTSVSLELNELTQYLSELMQEERGSYEFDLTDLKVSMQYDKKLIEFIKLQVNIFEDQYSDLLNEVISVIQTILDSGINWEDVHDGQFGRNNKGELVAFDLDGLMIPTKPKVKTMIKESKFKHMISFNNFSSKYKDSARKFFKGFKHEIQENGELRKIIYKYLKNKNSVTKEELKFVKEQSTDLLRMLGLVGIFILPASSLLLPALIIGAKKVGIELLPTGFRLEESMSENEIVNIIQDGKKIYVKYINGYNKHDIDKSYDPVDISGDEVTLEIDGDHYTTKLDWVIGIDENLTHYEVEPHMVDPMKDPTGGKDILWKDDEEFISLLKDQGGMKGLKKKMKKKYSVDYSDCKSEEDLYQRLKIDGFI